MFEKLLSRIGAALDTQGLPYMIIGGQAVLRHGEPRLTNDIDITLGVSIDRVGDLLELARQLDLSPLPQDINTFVSDTMVLPTLDEQSGIRVDFIFSFTPYEQTAISRAERVTILDQRVAFATVEDLIIHKIFAGRPRDLEDVRLVLLKNPQTDLAYIRSWLIEFDHALEKQEFIKSFEELVSSI